LLLHGRHISYKDELQDLRFWQRCDWRFKPPWILCHFDWSFILIGQLFLKSWRQQACMKC